MIFYLLLIIVNMSWYILITICGVSGCADE
jgi:hypothetical protein